MSGKPQLTLLIVQNKQQLTYPSALPKQASKPAEFRGYVYSLCFQDTVQSDARYLPCAFRKYSRRLELDVGARADEQ